MPENNDNKHLAGAIATGVALAAAGGLAVYSYFKNKNNNPNSGFQNHRNYPNSGYNENRNSPRCDEITSPSASLLLNYNSPDRVERTITTCDVCSREIKDDDYFGLSCDHAFHKRCLLAKYCLTEEKDAFKCPVQNCNVEVPEEKINALTQANTEK